MKQKNLAMLGVAVGCGLVAAVAVAKLSAGGSRGPDTVRILVAKKDIPLQTKLDEKNLDNLLAWADVPKSIAPPDPATDIEQVKDKELSRTLKQGNPVSLTDLGKSNRIILPDGCKQITFKATQVDAAGGFVKPGANVDILFVEKLNSGKARAAIILRHMMVLAVNMVHTLDEKTGAAIPQIESISLAVNDKQATLVALADERGKLKLLLKDQTRTEVEKKLDDGEIHWVEDPFDAKAPVAPVAAVAPAAQKFEQQVQVKKAIPLNTLINADNLAEFFQTTDVKHAPDGVIQNVDDLKGKYFIKAVDQGSIVYKSLTDSKPVEVKGPDKTPVVVEKPKYPRYEQIIQTGGATHRVTWMEVSPKNWKRFDSAKAADEYKPQAESPKGEEPKVVSE